MASKWRQLNLGELAPFVYGKGLPERNRDVSGTIPVYGSNGIVGYHNQPLTSGPTVIIGRKGTVGAVHYSAVPCWPIDTTFFISDQDTELVRYWFYLLKSLGLEHMNSDSAVPGLNRDAAHALKISIPVLGAEQRAIAHVLGTLDDKIELNRKMNETLESMALALFKSWFIDFDPVRAKMEGRWKRGESLPGLPAEFYDIFPERLVGSEFGDISENCKLSTLADHYDVAIGRTPPRKEDKWFSSDQNDVPWLSIRDLGCAMTYITEVSEYLTSEAVTQFRIPRIPPETVVLSFKLTVGRVAITDREMLSNEAIAHFIPKKQTFLSSNYLFLYLKQFNYSSLGSTSSIATAVNSQSLRAIPIVVPSRKVHDEFAELSRCMFEKNQLLQRECLTLIALRDTLLPKLISGQIRIKDAEKIVESHI